MFQGISKDTCPHQDPSRGGSGVLSTPKLTNIRIDAERIFKEEGDGDVDLNTRIKEYWEWEAKLETCDQKFAEKVRYQVIEVIKK